MERIPEPYGQQHLPVAGGHALYLAEFGDPQGIPTLFLHGGPGSGCNPGQAALFDPARFRLIQIDQRGCGRSRPAGAIADNDTHALLDDLETIRRHLAIDRWLIYGGSWGGTLAIEYAKRCRERVLGLVLRAPFLARREDLAWFTAPSGVATGLPDAYARLRNRLACRADEALIDCLTSRLDQRQSPRQAYDAALAWDAWEATVMGLPPPAAEDDDLDRQARIARKRIFAHYCRQGFFLGDDGVIPGIDELDGLPGWIVHGTRDRVCRYEGSRQLVERHLPAFVLDGVQGAGHGSHEAAIQDRLRKTLAQASADLPRR